MLYSSFVVSYFALAFIISVQEPTESIEGVIE